MNSLFARIMAVVLSVILLLTVALSVMSYFSLREQRIIHLDDRHECTLRSHDPRSLRLGSKHIHRQSLHQ